MAGTVAFDLREALVINLGPLLGSVPIHYGHPGAHGRTEAIWLGTARDTSLDSDHEPKALRAGRVRRSERLRTDVVIEITSKTTSRDAEERAVELGTVIEEYLADNPTVGSVENLLWCQVEGIELDTTETANGPRCVLVYTLLAASDLL